MSVAKVKAEALQTTTHLFDSLKEGRLITGSACTRLKTMATRYVNDLEALTQQGGSEDDYWKDFQKLFDFTRGTPRYTPMNAANLCPEPAILLGMNTLLRESFNRNVAQQTRTIAGTERGIRVQQLEAARKALAEGLGCRLEDLAIVRNASEGNNAISCGYRHWNLAGKEENVVLWRENHPTNLTSWELRREWEHSLNPENPLLFEIRYIEATTEDFKGRPDEFIFEKFKEQIDSNTRFVSFSETSNGSGARIPLSVIRDLWTHVTRNFPNCHIHIDGTMAWGAANPRTDLPLAYCHSFVSSAHKWFLGPKETGILYMRPEKVKNFTPSIYAYDYKIDIESDWRKMPETALRFELIGQRDDVNIISLHFTQIMWQMLEATPGRHPADRVIQLATSLRQQIKNIAGWKEEEIRTPESPLRSRGIIRVEAPRQPDTRKASLYQWIYDQNGIHIAGGGGGKTPAEETFRLCPHIYNTKRDIDLAVRAMARWKNLS